jgi:hypothetical protein
MCDYFYMHLQLHTAPTKTAVPVRLSAYNNDTNWIHFYTLDNAELQRRGLGDTQRQARELISGPCLGAKARLVSFNRTKSRAVTGLLTGHYVLRRHLHLMGLSDSPLCGMEHRMKPRPTFFVSVKLWLHPDMCIWAPSSWSQRTSRV